MNRILQTNCSEATWRLRIDHLTETEKEELINKIKKLEKKEWWYGTDWEERTIFGIKIIMIKGDSPYNSPDELLAELEALPFWNKIEKEEEE